MKMYRNAALCIPSGDLGLPVAVTVLGAATIGVAGEAVGRVPLSSPHGVARALAVIGAVGIPVRRIPHTKQLREHVRRTHLQAAQPWSENAFPIRGHQDLHPQRLTIVSDRQQGNATRQEELGDVTTNRPHALKTRGQPKKISRDDKK